MIVMDPDTASRHLETTIRHAAELCIPKTIVRKKKSACSASILKQYAEYTNDCGSKLKDMLAGSKRMRPILEVMEQDGQRRSFAPGCK